MGFRRAGRAATVLLVLVAFPPGCSSADTPDSTRTTLPGPAPTTTSPHQLSFREIARIEANDVRFVDVFGDRATWTTGDTKGGRHTRAMVHDLRTGKTTVAAQAATAGGAIEWSRGSGDTIVYTDQDYGPDPEADPTAPWRVVAVDLTTGKSQVLDHDRDASERRINPTVHIAWPWVSWIRPTKVADRWDLVALDLRTGARSTVVSGQDIWDFGVAANTLVFSAPSSQGRDLFAIDLASSGGVRQLTKSGQVRRFSKIGGSSVAYEEPVSGDPMRLLAVPLVGGDPIELRSGRTGGNIVSGDGFVAWYGDYPTVQVGPIRAGASPSVVATKADIPTRLSADGKRVAWGEQRDPNDARKTFIVVAELTQ